MFAKQVWPSSHSAFVPLGQGLALSQLPTRVSHDEPQKNFDSVSSTVVSGAVVPELSFSDASEVVGLPPVGLSSAIGSLDLQGVPLKHSCFSGQSVCRDNSYN